MKHLTILLFFFPILLKAQNYPLDIGFSNVLSGQLPAGWSGDMPVMNYHGLNDDKGIAGLISGGDKEDSVITDWVGPLDDYIQIIFWYRFVDENIYPSTEKNLTSDKLTLSMSNDGLTYFPIYTIDSSNHLSSLNFKKIDFNLSGHQGETVKFKFWARHGKGSSYYVDIDSIKVRKDFPPPVGVFSPLYLPSFEIYPNPVVHGQELHIQYATKVSHQIVSIYNLIGEKVLQHTIDGNDAVIAFTLQPGAYFVTDGNSRKKIIIQ